MQQAISRDDVYGPELVASLAGRTVEVASATVDRELRDPFAGGSFRAAGVTLDVAEGANVVQSVATPWDPSTVWPPAPESAASLTLNTGAGPVALLTRGRVTAASGGSTGRTVTVEVADAYQSLDKSISWESVAEAMPATADGGDRRFVGMWTPSITDTILRRCGWYSTPNVQAYSVLSVPAQGTLWPERGEVTAAGPADASLADFPRFGVTEWGFGTYSASATYTVAGGYTIKERGRVELSAMTSAFGADDGTGRVSVMTGTAGGFVNLVWSKSSASLRIGGDGMTGAAVATVARADGLLYATVERVSDTSVKVTLRSGTNTQTVTVAVPSSIVTGAVSTCSILVDGARSGGFQVAFPGVSGGLVNWTANAVLHPRASGTNRLVARPAVESENCADLLAQQCEAEGGTYWIDETGILHWWDMALLESRSVVASLTSEDDVAATGFKWSHDLSRVKSKVHVKWREAAQEFSSLANVDLWQGSGITLLPGQIYEAFVEIPDDEVWLNVDDSLNAPNEGGNDDFNYAIGSWFAGVVENQDQWAHNLGTLTCSFTKVTERAYRLRLLWSGTGRCIMKTISRDANWSTLWKPRRDMSMPVVRGRSKVSFTDRDTVGAATGPTSAPEYTIDAGWWIQYEAQAQYTANLAAERLTVPQPVLSSIDLVPIPGLQLGDVVRITDADVTRLTIEGIVLTDSRSLNAQMDMEHSITVRPLSVTRNSVSWSEWATEARPKSWHEWYLNQQSTWSAWGADPLAKE